MSIDMNLEQSQVQSTGTDTLAQSLETGFADLQSAIQTFAADTTSLKGKAYDSARSYYEQVLLPLAQGGELFATAVKSSVAKLPSEYVAQVDSKSWKQTELEQKIASEKLAITELTALRQGINGSDVDSDTKETLLRANTESIRAHNANVRAYTEILNNLIAFSDTSKTYFTEAQSLLDSINTGIKATAGSWDAKTGTFTIPSNLTWANTLKAKYTVKDMNLSEEDKAYAVNLATQYGFDTETIIIILKVRDGINKKFPDMSRRRPPAHRHSP